METLAYKAVPLTPVRRHSKRLAARRRTLSILFAVLLVSAVLVFAPRAVHMMPRLQEPASITHVVAPGDTLWDIAAQYAGGDIRKAVSAIRRVNGLPTATVHPGQSLTIPLVTYR